MFSVWPHGYLVLTVNAFPDLFGRAVTFYWPAHGWIPCACWACAASWGVTPDPKGHEERAATSGEDHRPTMLGRPHSRQ